MQLFLQLRPDCSIAIENIILSLVIVTNKPDTPMLHLEVLLFLFSLSLAPCIVVHTLSVKLKQGVDINNTVHYSFNAHYGIV